MSLSPDKVVGHVFVGGLFDGLLLCTFFNCIRWLVFTDEGWKVRKKINWGILSITVALCVLSTVFKALDLQDSMGQVMNASKPKLNPPSRGLSFQSTTLPWVAVVKCTDANVSALLADGVLIYRCWLIYGKSRRIIVFPVFLWMGGLVLTVLQVYWQIVQSASVLKAWQPVNMALGPGTILVPFWLSTILLNGYSTFAIVRRIYRVTKDSEGSTSVHQLRFVMMILVESGFLYLAVAVAHFVCWWTPNAYAIKITSAINISVTGIAFNLILIRAAQNRAEEMTKAAHLGPISDIQFNVNQTRTPAERFEVETTEAIAFRRPHAANSIMQSSVTSIV